VDIHYPGALTLEAWPRLAWIPMKRANVAAARARGRRVKDQERIPITIQEDLFGCFDLIVFPREKQADPTCEWPECLVCVQVTTMHADGTDRTGTVATRKKKIATWFQTELEGWHPDWLSQILVLGWVPRKHFRVWEWNGLGWKEQSPAPAPLPKKARAKSSPSRERDSAQSLDHPRSSFPQSVRIAGHLMSKAELARIQRDILLAGSPGAKR
jgi:hypothetical protein